MIEYKNTGELCSSDGAPLPTTTINGRRMVYVHHVIFAMHHGYAPERIGRVDGDVNNDRIENLYDMTSGTNDDLIYRQDGTLWTSDGRQMLNAKINTRVRGGTWRGQQRYRSHVVWEMHKGRPHRGRLVTINGNPLDTRIENLAENGGRYLIRSATWTQRTDPLWEIFSAVSHGTMAAFDEQLLTDGMIDADGAVTDVGRDALATPPTADAREVALHRLKEPHVPRGHQVVRKDTLGSPLRRVLIERLVAEGAVCYEEGCYRLTSPATSTQP